MKSEAELRPRYTICTLSLAGRTRTNCSQCEKNLTLQTSVKVLYVFVVLLVMAVVVLAALGE